MPKVLNARGRRAAEATALEFIYAYQDYLEDEGIKTVGAASKGERVAAAFFKKRARTSGYAPQGFPDQPNRGCKTAKQTLHPHPHWWQVELGGSKTVNLPRALVDIKRHFRNELFVSGHVINADFGGDHRRSDNQTVLTQKANGQHHFDESVKAATAAMSRACWDMVRNSHVSDAAAKLAEICNEWTITIEATVGDESWHDRAGPSLKARFPRGYPLNAVATKIEFTATIDDKPSADHIADNLKIRDQKMPSIARSIGEFEQFMKAAQSFTLYQQVPKNADGTSKVWTE